MTQFSQTAEEQLPFLPGVARPQQRQLLRFFWFAAFGLFGYELFLTNTSSLLVNFSAILITAAALLPIYLWCAGKALGLPIFPLSSLTYLWTHALPLLSNPYVAATYSVSSQLFVSLTVAGFIVLGTLIWFQFVKSPPPLPKYYRVLSSRSGDTFFLLTLVLSILFEVANNGGWLTLTLPGGVFTAVRSAIVGLTVLGIFVLSYRLGTQELSKQQSSLFLVLLVTYMVTSAVSFLLVVAASSFLVACVAFVIGRKKIPILAIVIVLIGFSFLQPGKTDMRGKYWFGGQNVYFQPWDYPSVYSEWAGYSLNYLNKPHQESQPEERQSFAERSSTIQLLLLAQEKSPKSVPYLYGETYAILPELIVPRIFNVNKIRSDEGTAILSVHYGLQTYEDTFTTTIGWSLIAEAYANFGILGCTFLTIILAIIYGIATRWSINAPILSAQSMFAILIITFAFQTEWTAGVYVAALFQSGFVVAMIVTFFMDNYWLRSSSNY